MLQEIHFEGIVPAPLAGAIPPHSEVWNKPLAFQKGKKYLIYAPSGKGKSTFTHILYGLRRDFAGQVHFDQKPLAAFSAQDWASLRQNALSIVFQDLRLFPELSAWENLQAKALLYPGYPAQELERMLDALGMLPLKDRKASQLSYGERQRVAIVRALIQPFDFLLLDEPFSHLDEGNTRKAAALIEEKRAAQNAALLMTSLGDEYINDFEVRLLLA